MAEQKLWAKKKLPKEGASDKKKRRAKRSVKTYKIYTFKVLKRVHPDITIPSKATGIMNSFINRVFEKLTRDLSENACSNEKPAITFQEIQMAFRLVLPSELAKHAVLEGTKAVVAQGLFSSE